MTRERVSTIIPVFNGAAFLADALGSILAQDEPCAEVVVVDDGSTDRSAQVAASFGGAVRIVSHAENRGLPAARNTGVAEASGELIAFLDADDLWAPNKTSLQLDILAREPATDIAVGYTQKLRLVARTDAGAQFEPWADPELALSMGASLFRRRAFETVGAFDTELPFTNDWDWFMRAREQRVVITVHPDVVQYYRRHESNMTEAIDEGDRYTLQMLRKSLVRRRDDATGPAGSLPPLTSD